MGFKINKIALMISIITISYTSQVFSESDFYKPGRFLPDIKELIKENTSKFKIEKINEIFPIGWSVDGKFAFIEYKEADGKPIIAYKLKIQDLITDRIVWDSGYLDVFDLYDEYIDNGNESEFDDYGLEIESPEFFYEYKKVELEEMLSKYKIIQPSQFTLNTFPLRFTDNIYKAQLNILNKDIEQLSNEDLKFYGEYSYNAEMIAPLTGRKIIHSEELIDKDVMGVQILGYLKSPYEDRIAVIVGVYQWRYHTGHKVDFRVIGCDLTSGFNDFK